MSILFTDNNYENLIKADSIEFLDFTKKYALFEVTQFSSEGNSYSFSGWDFESMPNYDDLYKCAKKDFEEYYERTSEELTHENPNFYDLRDEIINKLMNGYIIVDLEKLKKETALKKEQEGSTLKASPTSTKPKR